MVDKVGGYYYEKEDVRWILLHQAQEGIKITWNGFMTSRYGVSGWFCKRQLEAPLQREYR